MSETKQARLRKLEYARAIAVFVRWILCSGVLPSMCLTGYPTANSTIMSAFWNCPMTNCFPGRPDANKCEELRSPLLDSLLSLAHMNPTD